MFWSSSTSAAPVDEKQEVHIHLASLDLRNIGLPHTQRSCQLNLRQTRLFAQGHQFSTQGKVARVVNGGGHSWMLYPDLEYSICDYLH